MAKQIFTSRALFMTYRLMSIPDLLAVSFPGSHQAFAANVTDCSLRLIQSVAAVTVIVAMHRNRQFLQPNIWSHVHANNFKKTTVHERNKFTGKTI